MLRIAAFVALLAVPLLPARGQQQDDPFETHLYNVEFLTEPVTDHPGEALSLSSDAIGLVVAGESELSSGLLTGEDLAALIKANVSEDSWEHVSAAITYS